MMHSQEYSLMVHGLTLSECRKFHNAPFAWIMIAAQSKCQAGEQSGGTNPEPRTYMTFSEKDSLEMLYVETKVVSHKSTVSGIFNINIIFTCKCESRPICVAPGICWTSDNHCIYQPRNVRVREGDTVTIPCSYTYPEDLKGKSQIVIQWGEHDRPYCSNIRTYIADIDGNILEKYKERMSTVTHPDKRTASLIIRGWKPSDGTAFCCTATIYRTDNKPFTWSDTYGTNLTFEDGRSVYQVEELMAVPGEELIIPCYYPLKTLGEAQQVTWYTGDTEQCEYNKNIKIYSWNPTHPGGEDPYSLVNFPEDVSLSMHHVQGYHRFCCYVITRTETILSKSGTELIIADPPSSSSPFNVTQPNNMTGHRGESVTLSCSYTSYLESDVLGTTIYWRLGNLSGPYVYHPYKEMVHPGYRGRTEITGAADLHIQGLQRSDDAMYYCFVVIRVCTGNDKYKKPIQYGGGTRLTVTDSHNVSRDKRLVVIASISGAVLLVLLCLILVILNITVSSFKEKGLSGKKDLSDRERSRVIMCGQLGASPELMVSFVKRRISTFPFEETLYYEIPEKWFPMALVGNVYSKVYSNMCSKCIYVEKYKEKVI
ncbi:uncharacterized protein [Dendropsophus ebraccatus]|uniref:uncharacterized protein n=1 Tax=Dendropsophus ebraccatus TaxID=150705 RepID=UPI0038316F88